MASATRQVDIFRDASPEAASIPPVPGHQSEVSVLIEASERPIMPQRKGSVLSPTSFSNGRAPLAQNQPRVSQKPESRQNSFLAPQRTVFATDSPTKKRQSSASLHHASERVSKPVQTIFPRLSTQDKENQNPPSHSDNFAEFPDPSYEFKISLEKPITTKSSLSGQNSKKPQLEPATMPQLPQPCEIPYCEDNGTKPPYSYASLIGTAILRAPNRRLTLSQIYKWISDTFSYYRIAESSWQNSIRHNLSLNKAFVKQERPKDDPGKGNYWAVQPGMEYQFIKDKSGRRPLLNAGPAMKTFSQPLTEPTVNLWSASAKPLNELSAEPSGVTDQPSSDATIPESDAVFPDRYQDGKDQNSVPPSFITPSSPLSAMNSSPPLNRPSEEGGGTPPKPVEWPLPPANSRSRKRKSNTMDDSGYFSSLESSAIRLSETGHATQVVEAEPDRARIKRGRAEEEIARIRSSSHDISPTKNRTSCQGSMTHLVSSSPLRCLDSSLMIPPLTPAVTFKLPPKPPASISPNTNLRNHRNKIRELVGSPVKGMSLLHNEAPFSPAFNIADDEKFEFKEEFGMCVGDTVHFYSRPHSASPEKYSSKRTSLDRANKVGTILAEVTGNNMSSRSLRRGLRSPYLATPNCHHPYNKSPLASLKTSKREILDLSLLDEEDPDELQKDRREPKPVTKDVKDITPALG
ncbi:MAG: hypothetical protein Q9167_004046 [Letrouitia subvulpina]